ncbi:hypothetical protein MRB53_004036 [Persea americana]|uniref:Uncharacterized protein n=1 Tax=Persea americana TaxID=3435 RepID=A0ACC2MZY8_PERAE|nr:hypothetical protein MRB53_004036 [Persea americana]|eukprot:TRINITY_DN3049_c0_g1_i1.p1 TRINITY_DN3049_c0_g1~~TRINITY_DN3049_c0_g1_i1.p1  ORF type:complete len:237 (+),score=43.85 TRINITY_DN3049_c0_g1_i1:520-1230(+)
MATDEGFTSFSQLLESGDVGLGTEESLLYPSSFSDQDPPQMLCFGDRSEMGFSETGAIAQKSGGCDSSSTSSSSGGSFSKLRKAGKSEAKEEGKGRGDSLHDTVRRSDSVVPDSSGKACKKSRTELTTSKGKRVKLGERITALQKLVSPFGKTDTASVLHEAMGYIRFLHDQVQVLSSPYMQRLPSSAHLPDRGEEESRLDLRSRGLCLVPVSCTVNVANSNGADFWSPAMGNNSS